MLLKCVRYCLALIFTITAVAVSMAAEDDFKRGERLYRAKCEKCHGFNSRGTNTGPPLVHRFYVPSHHGDASFYFAVENGVKAHHWNFGDMKRVEGVSRQDVGFIIVYIRALQKKAGLN